MPFPNEEKASRGCLCGSTCSLHLELHSLDTVEVSSPGPQRSCGAGHPPPVSGFKATNLLLKQLKPKYDRFQVQIRITFWLK